MRHARLICVVLLSFLSVPLSAAKKPDQTNANQNLFRISVALSAERSGLLHELVSEFKLLHPKLTIRINGVGAIQAFDDIRNGKADFVITNYAGGETLLGAEGFTILSAQLMYNEYILLGPVDDHFDIQRAENITAAFKIIEKNKLSFLMPSKNSGTHVRTREIWNKAGINTIWRNFQNTKSSSLTTMLQAANNNAYTLIDEATYLLNKDELAHLSKPLLHDSKNLRNIYTMSVANAKKNTNANQQIALKFFDFLASAQAQQLIHQFGIERYGKSIFTPVAQFDPTIRARNQELILAAQDKNVAVLAALLVFLGLFTVITLYLFIKLKIKHREQQSAINANLELTQLRDAAVSASHAKSSFLANMSHEIRTPLTAIIGFAEQSLNKNSTMDSRLNGLKSIIRNGKHLLSLINDILDISKVEAEKLEVEKINTSCAQLIYDVKSILRAPIEEKGLLLNINYHYPVPSHIQTDPVRLKQILVNLCSNAIKFTANGSITIDIKWLIKTNQLQIDVTDTGIGMNESQLTKIFDAFTQADTSTTREYGGTGLGLSLSRQLAEKLGGDLTAHSIPGTGSTFSLLITTGKISADGRIYSEKDLPSDQNDSVAIAKECHVSGSILLAEDSTDLQELFSIYLDYTGADYVVVGDGEQACTAALNTPFDLIFMDMQMPVMDGTTAVKKLRNAGYQGTIVALTANAMSEQKQACVDAGFDDFLAKPIDTDVFYAVINQNLTAVEAKKPTGKPVLSALVQKSERFTNIVNTFVEGLPERTNEIHAALENNDMETFSKLIHKLKGAGGNMGYTAITDLCTSIEFQVISNELEQIEALLTELDELVIRILAGAPKHSNTTQQPSASSAR